MPPKQTVATGGGAIFSGPSPAYYDRRAERLQQSMQMAANMLMQKREQQRKTVEAQAKMIIGDPYAAVTGAGQEWLDKYGEANPIMAAQVKAAMRKGEPIMQGQTAAQEWMAGASEDNEFRDRARAGLDSLPEMIPGVPEAMPPMMSPAGPPGGAPPGAGGLLEMLAPMMSPAGPLPGVQPGPGTPQMQLPTEVPNPERAELEERFATFEGQDPGLLRFYALPAQQQELVKMGLLSMDMESPPTINDLMERMTPTAVDSYLAAQGVLDPDTVESIRIRSGQAVGKGRVDEAKQIGENLTATTEDRVQFKHDLTLAEIEARKDARLEELQYTRESQRLAREGKAAGTAGTAEAPTTPDEAFQIHNEAWLEWKERRADAKIIVSEAMADYKAEEGSRKTALPKQADRFKWDEELFRANDPEPPRVTTNDFNELKKITAALPDQTEILRVLLDDVESGRKTAAEVLETAREITGTAERAGPVVQFGGEIGETMERTFEKSMSVEPRTQPLVPRGAGGR